MTIPAWTGAIPGGLRWVITRDGQRLAPPSGGGAACRRWSPPWASVGCRPRMGLGGRGADVHQVVCRARGTNGTYGAPISTSAAPAAPQ
eukprot:gene14414-biopygen8100